MGVYIPNMSKPKDSCWECKAQYNSICSLKLEHIGWDGILDDCPLIEIDLVRCGECKWKDECILGSYGVSEGGFCYKGERRE